MRPEREAFAAAEWQPASLIQHPLVSHATTHNALQVSLRARSWATRRRQDIRAWQAAWAELHDADDGHDDGQGKRIWRDAMGRPHRPLGPSVIDRDTTIAFHVDGRLHRTDGPAVIGADGTRRYFQHGACHRTFGPAVIDASGRQEWWDSGRRHRRDGPAIIHPDGTLEYWRDGIRIALPDAPAARGDYSLANALFGAGGCG